MQAQDEVEVMELAADLLAAAGHGRLDRFLGDLVEREGLLPAGSALAEALAGELAEAAGQVVRSSRRGAAELADDAEHLLGLALEGLSPEDQEFEAAKQIVYLAGAAIRGAAAATPGAAPRAAARSAITRAAEALAPGLSSRLGRAAPPASGRWYRRGDRIIVEGV